MKVSLKLKSFAAVGKFWLKLESLNELGKLSLELESVTAESGPKWTVQKKERKSGLSYEPRFRTIVDGFS